MQRTVTIILPVFNDWPSFAVLLKDIDLTAANNNFRAAVLVVDDGSTDPCPENLFTIGVLTNIDSVECIRLSLNLGHQRALAVGMCASLDSQDVQQIVIMDADGEDRPEDINLLLQSADAHPNSIIVAQRRRRNEKLSFRAFYKAYKFAFFLLTGKEISFGNFCCLNREHASRLSMVPDLWNNLPAALMRSRLPLELVPIDRGYRYFGSSKMNFVTLSVHGMSAYSVYTDAILVRLLILTFCLSGVGIFLAGGVAALRLFTNLATPGWATTVVFGTAIIVSQAMFTTLTSALLLLNNRSQKHVVPALECKHFIYSRSAIPFNSAATS